MSNYTTVINIPAYDTGQNDLIINFKLTSTSNCSFSINTAGNVKSFVLEKLIERS